MTPDGWLRTGDVGLFRKGPEGNDHLFIVDRLKDMLKVKVRRLDSCTARRDLRLDELTRHRAFRLLQQTLKRRCYAIPESPKQLSLESRMSYQEREQWLSSSVSKLI